MFYENINNKNQKHKNRPSNLIKKIKLKSRVLAEKKKGAAR